MKEQTGATLLARALQAEGVERAFAVPGEENLHLLEALRHTDIELIVARHEQSAGFMAATEGRLTEKPGVCLATLGPGATNLVTAAAHAQLGAMPMVMITGQKPLRDSRQAAFQLLDVVGMMRPLTKFSETVVAAETIPHRVREAFHQAEEERPGAVHLELPEDIAQDPVAGDPLDQPLTRRPVAEGQILEQAIAWIAAAQRPLLLIGAGANRKRCTSALTAFVDKLRMPFVTTQLGKGVVSEERNECLGTAALSEADLMHAAFEHADLVINAGYDPIEKPPFLMRDDDTLRVIHVDFSSPRAEPVYAPHLEVIGDIGDAFERLTAALPARPPSDPDLFRAARSCWIESIEAPCTPEDRGPRSLAAALVEQLPPETRIVLDNGMYKIWFARNYRVREPNQMLLDNALATMGAGLPGAMASRIVEPDRPVVAICGDGGFLMNAQELETAVRLELDLCVLVLVDSGYGMIRWKQNSLGFPDYGLAFGNPDFVRFAEAHGAQGRRVEDRSELARRVSEALATGGVHLFEVPVAYEADNKLLDQEYPRIAHSLRGQL